MRNLLPGALAATHIIALLITRLRWGQPCVHFLLGSTEKMAQGGEYLLCVPEVLSRILFAPGFRQFGTQNVEMLESVQGNVGAN